jgi:hypothetical protein
MDFFLKKSLDFWQKISKNLYCLKKKAVLDIYGVFQGFCFSILWFWMFGNFFPN